MKKFYFLLSGNIIIDAIDYEVAGYTEVELNQLSLPPGINGRYYRLIDGAYVFDEALKETQIDEITQKTLINLGNIDNTSDLAKPVSMAQQAALNLKASVTSTALLSSSVASLSASVAGKANISSPTFTGTVSGITKAMIGLGSVDDVKQATVASYTATFGVEGWSISPSKISNQFPTITIGSGIGTASSITWSADSMFMSVGHFSSPYVTIYKRSFDSFGKLDNPGTLPTGIVNDVAWSQDGTYLSVAHSSSPYITIYKRSVDTLTKLTDPATLPTSTGLGVAWSSDDVYLSVAHESSPYVTIYKRSIDTFTKLTNSNTLPTSTANGVAWYGNYLTVAHNTSPYITIYERSVDTFTKLSNPATLPTGDSYAVAWSSLGGYMGVAHSSSPYVTIYQRSIGTFTKLNNPAILPTGIGYGVAFTAGEQGLISDDAYISVSHDVSPYVSIYRRSASTFIKLNDPTTLPTGTGNDVKFSLDFKYMTVAHATSPHVTIYNLEGREQTKTITGIAQSDVPITDLFMQNDYNKNITQNEEWSKIYRVTTNTNSATLYAIENPNVSLDVQFRVVK